MNTTDRIRRHYRDIGLSVGWDAERFRRLCTRLNRTVDEMSAMCLVPQSRMDAWLKQDLIPPYVALHYAIIESAWIEATTGHRGKPIIPIDL